MGATLYLSLLYSLLLENGHLWGQVELRGLHLRVWFNWSIRLSDLMAVSGSSLVLARPARNAQPCTPLPRPSATTFSCFGASATTFCPSVGWRRSDTVYLT